jgi:formylglycine-generating enzyme required for sulfatase activity
MMGSPTTETGHTSAEAPQHMVTIAKRFAVSKFDVTFDEWDICADNGDCAQGLSDSGWGRGNRPAINVTWDDAQRYVAWLSKMTGQVYRLLSEAEYEYAARAGAQTAYPWGDDIGQNNSNCRGCGSQWDNIETAPVGSFAPNGFGLYDIVGNVWQWTEDCMHTNYDDAPSDGSAWIENGVCNVRIFRGGAWGVPPNQLRSGVRGGQTSDLRNSGLGFRVGRTLSDGPIE